MSAFYTNLDRRHEYDPPSLATTMVHTPDASPEILNKQKDPRVVKNGIMVVTVVSSEHPSDHGDDLVPKVSSTFQHTTLNILLKLALSGIGFRGQGILCPN
ncbi:hypothetical protein QCA50_009757 [Cerrena zonata]|uniref:Uncharacterized protein n=1 Tax=Cerrena zonata TaxID=2478898 RepID=A0AAW0GBG0_9APHY